MSRAYCRAHRSSESCAYGGRAKRPAYLECKRARRLLAEREPLADLVIGLAIMNAIAPTLTRWIVGRVLPTIGIGEL